jgi:hypothetical protein
MAVLFFHSKIPQTAHKPEEPEESSLNWIAGIGDRNK